VLCDVVSGGHAGELIFLRIPESPDSNQSYQSDRASPDSGCNCKSNRYSPFILDYKAGNITLARPVPCKTGELESAYSNTLRGTVEYTRYADFPTGTSSQEETMNSPSPIRTLTKSRIASIRERIGYAVDDLLVALPDPKQLSADQRRDVIARYTAVLEGNFIYWMTGAYLSVRSVEARSIILENLHEEVRDSHPAMLRKFAIAAHAAPTDSDSAAVYRDLTNVRLFVGQLSAVRTVIMMTFFEQFIQRFMPFLAELAQRQGSTDLEYSDVHRVCDIAHTEGLFHTLTTEMALDPSDPGTDLFEGVALLHALLQTIVNPAAISNVLAHG